MEDKETNYFQHEDIKSHIKVGSLQGEINDIYFWIQSKDY